MSWTQLSGGAGSGDRQRKLRKSQLFPLRVAKLRVLDAIHVPCRGRRGHGGSGPFRGSRRIHASRHPRPPPPAPRRPRASRPRTVRRERSGRLRSRRCYRSNGFQSSALSPSRRGSFRPAWQRRAIRHLRSRCRDRPDGNGLTTDDGRGREGQHGLRVSPPCYRVCNNKRNFLSWRVP